ncbi:MAG: hypothetical protein ACPHK8_06950 [Thermoplasmatota archaeon]
MRAALTVALLLLALAPVGQAQETEPCSNTAATPHVVFQAHNQNDQLGYDYTNGVERDGDYVKMDAYPRDRDFLALNLEGGTDYQAFLRFDASEDGRPSVMHWAFSYTGQAVGEGQAGNGYNTGGFANSLQLRFEEDGNTWKMALRQVVDGDITVLQTSTLSSPNSLKTVSFAVCGSMKTLEARAGDGSAIMTTEYTANFDEPSSYWTSFDAAVQGTCIHSGCSAETRFDTRSPSTQILALNTDGPEIENVLWSPAFIEAGQPFTVQSTVTDDHGVQNVYLWHTVNGGAATSTSMTGDPAAASIGPFQEGDEITFYVTATDVEGNEARSDTYEATAGGDTPTNVGGGTGGGSGSMGGGPGDKGVTWAVFVLLAVAGLAIFIGTRESPAVISILGTTAGIVLPIVAVFWLIIRLWGAVLGDFFTGTSAAIIFGITGAFALALTILQYIREVDEDTRDA